MGSIGCPLWPAQLTQKRSWWQSDSFAMSSGKDVGLRKSAVDSTAASISTCNYCHRMLKRRVGEETKGCPNSPGQQGTLAQISGHVPMPREKSRLVASKSKRRTRKNISGVDIKIAENGEYADGSGMAVGRFLNTYDGEGGCRGTMLECSIS